MAAVDRQAVILDAIDSIRRRKARPDLERICHMVERKYGLTNVDVITELDRLVDADIVIKVDYKGNTSYRNAAKWCKSRLGGNPLNSNDATRSILAAIEKLTVQESLEEPGQVLEAAADCPTNGQPKMSNGALGGASLEEIEKFFADENPDTKFTRIYLEEALKREVGARRLYIGPSNKFVLAKFAVSYEDKEAFQLKRAPRPPKRKRIKKTHGPDWEQEPLIKTSMWDQRCDYCTLPASCNKFGDKEELLVCKDCTLKVHPSCMKYSRQLAERSRLSPWQCIDCKTCHVCNDAGDADTLLFCDSCDKGYHMACHNPKVEEKPLGKWMCELCAGEDMEIGSNYTDEGSTISSTGSIGTNTEDKNDSVEKGSSQTSGQATPDVATPNQSRMANLPVQSAQSQASTSSSSPKNSSLPTHPANWSLDDVVKLLQGKGFTEEADTFRNQEIDGHALLLLRRSDVLTGLSFKLGPALKIYQIISKLQLLNVKDSSSNAKTKSSLQTTTPNASSSSPPSSSKNMPSTSSSKAPSKTKASSPSTKPSRPPNKPSETGKKQSPPKSGNRARAISPKTQSQSAKVTVQSNSTPLAKASPTNLASKLDKSTPTPVDIPMKTEAKSPRSASSKTTQS